MNRRLAAETTALGLVASAGAQVFFDRVRASGERGSIRVTVKAAGLRAAEACLSV